MININQCMSYIILLYFNKIFKREYTKFWLLFHATSKNRHR